MADQDSTCICQVCGTSYVPTFNKDGTPRKTKYQACSKICAGKLYAKAWYKPREAKAYQRPCAWCGVGFVASQVVELYCSKSCRHHAKHDRLKLTDAYVSSRRVRDSKRRALKRTTQVERIDPTRVFERDGWRCHLCGVKTLQSKRGTFHPRAPELEHIVALADGGTHTWGNVACSCSRCNRQKGPTSFGQLGLGFSV